MHSNSRSDLHVQKMWQVAVWWLQETPVSQPFPHEPIITKNVSNLQQCTVHVHHKLPQSENSMMVRLALEIQKGSVFQHSVCYLSIRYCKRLTFFRPTDTRQGA